MVHIHAEGPAFFCWIPKLFGKRVICTIHGLDWDREKWRGSVASKFIRGGEKNAVKYADEIIVLSKDVQKYFLETYGRETHFIPNGVNRPEVREAKLITDHFGLEKDSYILFLGRLVPEKGIRYLVEAFKNVKGTDNPLHIVKDYELRKLLWQSGGGTAVCKKYLKFRDTAPEKLTFPETQVDEPIWLFWNTGLDKAPEIVRTCYQSVKKYAGRQVVLLTEKNVQLEEDTVV